MSEPDEREPSDDDSPFGPRGPGVTPMSPFAAVLWTAGATFTFIWIFSLIAALREGALEDSIGMFGCQLVAYLGVLFLILRMYAPQVGIRQFVGLRPTHAAFYPVAILMGLAVILPANAIYAVIDQRFPGPEVTTDLLDSFREAGLFRKLVMATAFVGLGPLLEEVFFRGAIQKPLSRGMPVAATIGISAGVFALAHVDQRLLLPIGLVGLVLAFLRWASGSVVPSALAHMTFNMVPFASTVYEAQTGVDPETELPDWTLLVSLAVLLTLVLAAFLLMKTERARRAQAEDNDDRH